MKRVFTVFTAVFFCLLPVTPVLAADIHLTENYTLPPSEEIMGNLYVLTQSLVSAGKISGDAVFVAGNMVFSGKGTEDAIFIGGTVESSGLIGGDLRAVGIKLEVNGAVGGDAVLFGGSVKVSPGVLVQGNVISVGGNVFIGGNVLGDIYIAGGNVFINGKVSGDVKIYSIGRVEFGERTDIGGNVIYYSGAEANISDSANIAGTISHEFSSSIMASSDINGFISNLFGWLFLVRILVALASVMIFVLVFRRLSAEIVKISVDRFWKTLFIGLVTVFAIPFASIFLIITVLGSVIGVILLSVGFTMALLAKIYSGIIFGYLFSKYVLKRELPDILSWKTALLGSLALQTALLVPYAGIAVFALLFIIAFGAISSLAYKHFFTSR